MKNLHTLWGLAACLALCCGGAQAVTALGMTAEEMTALYGAGFAKQTAEAQKLMEEEWDVEPEEEQPAAETEQPAPAPQEEPAPKDEPKPQEGPAPQAESAPAEPGQPQETAPAPQPNRKALVAKTAALIKAKRAVDAKIKYSRNNITNLRKKLYGLAKKYDVEPADNFSGGDYSSSLSNIDLTVIKNSQRAIEKYKNAIPHLWVFSNELKEHIDKGMAAIGKSKNQVLRSYKTEDMQPSDGCEAEKDPIDKFNFKTWGG